LQSEGFGATLSRAFDVDIEDGGVVDEAVDGGHCGGFVGEHLSPLAEGLVCGDYVES